jgi:DinB superfamily
VTGPQLSLLTDRILRCIDRIIDLGAGLTDAQLAQMPGVAKWNSLGGIMWHVMANAEENILRVCGGMHVARDREYGFVDNNAHTRLGVSERWSELRSRLEAYFAGLEPADLDGLRTHRRRGQVTVLELLLVVLRHAGEHEGHAQMTRDYLLATGPVAD